MDDFTITEPRLTTGSLGPATRSGSNIPTSAVPQNTMAQVPGWDTYSPKINGPKYPPHDASAPIIGREDVPGLIIGVIMALGPLTAYASGFGL